jgi:hypothetical protein
MARLFAILVIILFSLNLSAKPQKITVVVDDETGKISINGDFDKDRINQVKQLIQDKKKSEETPPSITKFGGATHISQQQTITDLVVFWGDAVIDGNIEGDVISFFGDIDITETAVIDGQLVTIGGTIKRHPFSTLKGSTVNLFSLSSIIAGASFTTTFVVGLIYFFWIFSLSLLVGFIFNHSYPNRAKKMKNTITQNPAACLLIGICLLLAFIPINAILLISIIGIVIIPIFIIAYFILSSLGLAMVATAIGQQFPKRRSLNWNLTLGFVVLLVISLIPFLGKFILFLASGIGLGSIFVSNLGTRQST